MKEIIHIALNLFFTESNSDYCSNEHFKFSLHGHGPLYSNLQYGLSEPLANLHRASIANG